MAIKQLRKRTRGGCLPTSTFLDRARRVMARGTDFELQEGARAIATARVTDIVSETP